MRVLAIVSMLVVAGPAVAYGYREAEVRDAAARAGFESIADRVAAASLPTVLVGRRMLERAPRARGTSRLGGHPDLPAGARWPRCRGQAQTFLGQVRLSDVPTDADPLHAHDGVLLFFTHVQMESPGYGLWAGRCTSVLHAPEGAALTRKRPPRGSRLLRLRPAEMRFRMRPDIPDVDVDLNRLAAPLSDTRLSGREIERWWGLEALHRRPTLLQHRLLGHIRSPNGGSPAGSASSVAAAPGAISSRSGSTTGLASRSRTAGGSRSRSRRAICAAAASTECAASSIAPSPSVARRSMRSVRARGYHPHRGQ